MKFLKLCIEQCEFQKFKKDKFHCDLYERKLSHIQIQDSGLKVVRCRQCINEQSEYKIIEDLKHENT